MIISPGPQLTELARQIMTAGGTRADVARRAGFDTDWLDVYEKANPDLERVLNTSVEVANEHVVEALHARAVGKGAKHTVKRITRADGSVEIVETTESLVPDVPAIKYILNNRAGDRWQERHDIRAEIQGAITIDLPWMTGGRNLVIDMPTADSRQDLELIEATPSVHAAVELGTSGL